jgi:hypothetical protein
LHGGDRARLQHDLLCSPLLGPLLAIGASIDFLRFSASVIRLTKSKSTRPPSRLVAALQALHRRHGVVEDRVKTLEDNGASYLPFHFWQQTPPGSSSR